MESHELKQRFEDLLSRESKYPRHAYYLVQQATNLARDGRLAPDGSLHHVSARELLEALRDHAVRKWGNDARDFLAAIGIKTSDDVGEIVYNLVAIGGMRTSEKDSRAEFTGTFDFEQEFPKSPGSKWTTAWSIAVVVAVVIVLGFAARDLWRAMAR